MPRARPGTSVPSVSSDPRARVSITINGELVEREVSIRMLLSDFLRHELRLTGTHVGCEHGVCGACTVLIDGKAARACLTPMEAVSGRAITTIEGLEGAQLHPVQQAWIEQDVAQCGYCQAGQILAAVDLLSRKRSPSDEDIGEIANLCRCGTYPRIRSAIQRAAVLMTEGKS